MMVGTNPVLATRPYKVESDGFHTWTEDEIALFEERHPIGTKARLAFDLMLWTGQRGAMRGSWDRSTSAIRG